jgi:hypothetical protein
MSLGLMPASPKSPRTALHLALMEFLLEMRDTSAHSGTMMASFYNNWNKKLEVKLPNLNKQTLTLSFSQYKMEPTICQNLVPLYLELLENVDTIIEEYAEGFKDNHLSCPACPAVMFIEK